MRAQQEQYGEDGEGAEGDYGYGEEGQEDGGAEYE